MISLAEVEMAEIILLISTADIIFQEHMACNGFSSRERRETKRSSQSEWNSESNRNGNGGGMSLPPSTCVAALHSFFCIRRVKVFPFLDCIVHESLLSLPQLPLPCRLLEQPGTLSPIPFSLLPLSKTVLEMSKVGFGRITIWTRVQLTPNRSPSTVHVFWPLHPVDTLSAYFTSPLSIARCLVNFLPPVIGW